MSLRQLARIPAAAPLLAIIPDVRIPWFAILLMVAFYVLVAIEFLLPTGGLAGIGALTAIIAAVIIAAQTGVYWAVFVLAITTLTTPPLMLLLIRIWPRTAIGRRILNARDDDPPPPTAMAMTRGGEPLESLIGKRGTAVSDLLPSGMVKIQRQRLDAMSNGPPIDAGTEIIAIGLIQRRLQVRMVTPSDAAADTPTAPQSTGQTQSPPSLDFDIDHLAD